MASQIFTFVGQKVVWPGTLTHYICFALCVWALYMLVLAAYRVSFHPLTGFPGPKLASISYLYEFWFDVICWGRYTHTIQRMHERYGPIVRINPDELHCNDPRFMDTIYATGSSKRDKPLHFLHGFPASGQLAGVGTVDHSQHRLRRGAINKLFSRSEVAKLEGLIHANAQKLCDKIIAHRDSGPFEVSHAYSCFTSDVIAEYCFGASTGFLDQPGWEPNYKASVNILFRISHLLRHFPVLGYLMEMIPLYVLDEYSELLRLTRCRPIISMFTSDIARIMNDFKRMIPEWIRQTETVTGTVEATSRPTVFSALLESDLPPEEKSMHRLASEANAIMVGGTETTAATLGLLTFHLLDKPEIFRRLHAELSLATPDHKDLPRWQTLEQLPYFTAVISEAIRLIYGVSGRLARIATDEDLVYQGVWKPPRASKGSRVCKTIPRGYAVGMSAYVMHTDVSVFPSPLEFIPERWEDEGMKKANLHRHILSFSKGSRQCVGMQLAYCELYVCAAALILRVMSDMHLYKTTRSDVDYDHDELIGKPTLSSKGVRVLIT